MLWCDLLHISHTQHLLRLLDLYPRPPNLETFCPYVIQNLFLYHHPISFGGSTYMLEAVSELNDVLFIFCFTLGSFYCYVFKFTNLSAMSNLWFIPSSLFFITHIMFFTSKGLSWVFFVSSGYQLNFFNTWNTVIMNALVFFSAITLTPLRVLGQLQLTGFSPYREFYPASLRDWWFFYWISQIMNFTLLGTVNVGFLLKYSWIRSGK